MSAKRPTVAIVYDFDGTLAPGNMQEPSFIPSMGIANKKTFWDEAKKLARENQADETLAYMYLMVDKAANQNEKISQAEFKKHGEKIELYRGVESWFDRISQFGSDIQINVEHYLLSSGNREMLTGTSIASKFKKIYASEFMFDTYGKPIWPAHAVNYTTKTQYLFRINKDCHDLTDNETVNKFVPKSERPVPFENMIYIGDGSTDVPCFRLVKDQGGLSIAVYKPNTKGASDKAKTYLDDGRVHQVAPANYREGSDLDKLVKSFVESVKTRSEYHRLLAPQDQN